MYIDPDQLAPDYLAQLEKLEKANRINQLRHEQHYDEIRALVLHVISHFEDKPCSPLTKNLF